MRRCESLSKRSSIPDAFRSLGGSSLVVAALATPLDGLLGNYTPIGFSRHYLEKPDRILTKASIATCPDKLRRVDEESDIQGKHGIEQFVTIASHLARHPVPMRHVYGQRGMQIQIVRHNGGAEYAWRGEICHGKFVRFLQRESEAGRETIDTGGEAFASPLELIARSLPIPMRLRAPFIDPQAVALAPETTRLNTARAQLLATK